MTDDRNGGWHMMNLSDLVSLPEATFTTGGLVPVDRLVESLPEDPSNDTAYDGGAGIITRWYDLPNGALWLYAETPASTAEDIDLFVGRDEDGNGIASSWEELCSSTTPDDLERCDLYDLPPGNYFVIAQNWTASEAGSDEVTLLSAAIEPGDENSLAASGPGITSEDETFAVRLSWDNLKALPGETWLGAVGVGSNSEDKNNIGVIPVRFVRESTPQAIETFPLMNGRSHALALAANSKHDRVFIDVPPGASSLTVSTAGAEEDQTENLTLELVRMDYSAALANPPFTAPASGAVIATATGVNDTGPEITINNPTVGRWYAVLSNGAAAPAAIDVRADVAFNSAPFDPHPGLWSPSSRPNLGQGYDFNRGGSSQALIWYTYDENGQPTWYIAGGPASDNNIWVSDVLRVTNDGTDQQLAPVGALSITQLSASDALFSFTLFGHSGTDRMMPLSGLTCPSTGSQTGIWFKGVEGLGGASVLMNASTQAQIHYLFDDVGMPRWLFAQDLDNPAPSNSEVPMLQFSGYCAVCDSGTVSNEAVGVLARSFSSETAGSWTLDLSLIHI